MEIRIKEYAMIKREKYIAPIRSFYDSDLIKIITQLKL